MSWNTPFPRPSHRNPKSPQIESCELCGSLVERERLKVSDVEGLRGHAICDLHPQEAKLRSTPSYRDFKRYSGGRSASRTPRRNPPFGGPVWWTKDGK